MLLALIGAGLTGAPHARAFTYTPNVTTDRAPGNCDPLGDGGADCTLREAVIAANGAFTDDVIDLGGLTYTLSVAPILQANDAWSGDLVVGNLGTLTINGPGTIT